MAGVSHGCTGTLRLARLTMQRLPTLSNSLWRKCRRKSWRTSALPLRDGGVPTGPNRRCSSNGFRLRLEGFRRISATSIRRPWRHALSPAIAFGAARWRPAPFSIGLRCSGRLHRDLCHTECQARQKDCGVRRVPRRTCRAGVQPLRSNQALQPTPSRRDSFLFHDYNTSTVSKARSR